MIRIAILVDEGAVKQLVRRQRRVNESRLTIDTHVGSLTSEDSTVTMHGLKLTLHSRILHVLRVALLTA